MNIWIPIALFVLGVIFIYIEFFVPALGIIGGVGIICLIVSVILSYSKLGSDIGIFFLIALIIGTPGMILWGLRIFPKTIFGKKLILEKSEKLEEGFSSTSEKYSFLVGKIGIAASKLRPSGFVIINGKKYNAVTLGEMLDKNTRIRVIKVQGNGIVVKRVD